MSPQELAAKQDPFNFDFDDLAPIEKPVKYRGKHYVVTEASEDASCAYRNALMKGSRLNSKGTPSSVGDLADSEPILVSKCLFEVYQVHGEDRRRPVTMLQVLSWPSRVIKPLFEWIKTVSNLEEKNKAKAAKEAAAEATEAEAELKNGCSATAPTSASPESLASTSTS